MPNIQLYLWVSDVSPASWGGPTPTPPHPPPPLGHWLPCHSLRPQGSPTTVKQEECSQNHAQAGPAHARLAAEEESRGRPVGILEQQQAGGLLGKDRKEKGTV